MKTITLSVRGMTCGNCVRHVTEALRGLPGVSSVDVDLTSGRATVVVGDAVTVEALLAAIVDEGYEAAAA